MLVDYFLFPLFSSLFPLFSSLFPLFSSLLRVPFLSMNYSLTEQDMALISQLPSEIAALAERYPSEILNVADSWNNPSLPDGYIPEFIDVFYGDESVMFVNKGVLSSYTPINTQRNSISTSITVMIDSDFAYIEIEGKEILNKLGGVILPDVTVSASTLIIEIPGVS